MGNKSLNQTVQRAFHSALFRGGAWSLAIQGQLVILQLLTGIILARKLGPSEFGAYSFTLAVVTLIQIMPNSGLDNVVVRFSAQYNAQHRWASLRGLWRAATIAAGLYGILSAATVLACVILGWLPAAHALSPTILATSALPLCFLPMATNFGAALRAITPGVLGQLPIYVVRPWVYFLVLLALLLAVPQALTAENAMYAQGMAAIATVFLAGYWLWTQRPIETHKESPEYEYRPWLRAVLPYCLMGGLMLLNTQADVLLLGMLSSGYQTGLYKIAANGANIAGLSLGAANLYIGPRISALYTTRDFKRLQRLISLSVRSTFIITLVIVCVFWLWGSRLIEGLFGAAYLPAYAPLLILGAAQVINVGSGSVGLILNMTGHERVAVSVAAAAAVLNIALNLYLIPKLGGVGAAAATAITTALWNGLMLGFVRRRTGLNSSILKMKAVF